MVMFGFMTQMMTVFLGKKLKGINIHIKVYLLVYIIDHKQRIRGE